MTCFVNFQQSFMHRLMSENDFRLISCEIMDKFRSNFGSLLLVSSSVFPLVNNLQWVSCERNSSYTFGQSF